MSGEQISDNWLPKPWIDSAASGRVFQNIRINDACQQASTAYEAWRRNPSNQRRDSMSNLVGVYLDVASDEKERIRKTAWNGLGLTFISNETRTILYFVLAVLAAVFGVLVAAFEDYPGAISKPWTVIIYDVWAEVVLFTVIILESSYPAKWSLWHFFSGALGMATSIGRACMIAAFVDPWTPILTHRDRFNAVGVGCMNAIKWVYPLMARPVDRLPGVRVGQPFHEVRDRGRGLNSHERAHPLDVVMTPPR